MFHDSGDIKKKLGSLLLLTVNFGTVKKILAAAPKGYLLLLVTNSWDTFQN